jgi:hypothetical protein
MNITKAKMKFGIYGLIALISLAALFFAASGKNANEPQVIGDKERIRIIAPRGAVEVVAKIDTGADFTSIDAEFAKSIGLEANPARQKEVLSAKGIERRDTVRLTFVLGNRTISTLATLADRTNLTTDVLIGKRDVRGFLINPSKKFYTAPEKATKPSIYFLALRELLNRPRSELIIIFPILGAVVVLLRVLVGIKTYGIFAPVVIAFSLLEMNVFCGILIYVILIALGMGLKMFILKRFQLLHIAEMSLIMFFLVLFLMASMSFASGFPFSLSVVFFPLIITSHLIERASKSVEELRALEAFSLLGSTLATALVLTFIGKCLLTLQDSTVWIFFGVSVLSAVAMGRYTGLRFTEFLRFKYLRKDHESH